MANTVWEYMKVRLVWSPITKAWEWTISDPDEGQEREGEGAIPLPEIGNSGWELVNVVVETYGPMFDAPVEGVSTALAQTMWFKRPVQTDGSRRRGVVATGTAD